MYASKPDEMRVPGDDEVGAVFLVSSDQVSPQIVQVLTTKEGVIPFGLVDKLIAKTTVGLADGETYKEVPYGASLREDGGTFDSGVYHVSNNSEHFIRLSIIEGGAGVKVQFLRQDSMEVRSGHIYFRITAR